MPCRPARVQLPDSDGRFETYFSRRTVRLAAVPEGVLLQDSGGERVGRVVPDPLEPVRIALQSGAPWAGWISYDLGRHLEPAAVATHRGADVPLVSWPLIELHQLESTEATALPGHTFSLGPLHAASGPLAYQRGVARVLEFIRSGDCYQANLAHELLARFEGSPRQLFARLVERSVPPYAMYVEAAAVAGQPVRAMLSLSPELFLEYDARTRRVITRPMKGTRPCVPGAYDDLDASDKDRAELAMIVDLMRNDLGRVCAFGSVRVDERRRIERHDNAAGGMWQAIAQVSGTLREGLDAADLIAATFPAGSVTGAPKIRAMQIIDELEPVRRGIYCGSGIRIGADGSASLSVAIRTALIESDHLLEPDTDIDSIRGTLRYSVGAGIVADSNPVSEWNETLVKAGALGGVANLCDGAKP